MGLIFITLLPVCKYSRPALATSQHALTGIHGHEKLRVVSCQASFGVVLSSLAVADQIAARSKNICIPSSIICRISFLTSNLLICRLFCEFSLKFAIVHSTPCCMQINM